MGPARTHGVVLIAPPDDIHRIPDHYPYAMPPRCSHDIIVACQWCGGPSRLPQAGAQLYLADEIAYGRGQLSSPPRICCVACSPPVVHAMKTNPDIKVREAWMEIANPEDDR